MKQLLILLPILVSHTLMAQIGNVGIGTANPLARLHVADSSVLFSANGDIPFSAGLPPQQGSGRRLMWYPYKAAFRVGYVDGTQWDRDNIGNYSFAAGNSTQATGSSATALGFGTYAAGIASTALGNASVASGDYSTAIGTNAIAGGFLAMALGVNTYASNPYSVAMGSGTIGSGDYSMAMGQNTIAYGLNSTAMGYQTYAGVYSIAMGHSTRATGYTSTAMGTNSEATGYASTASGDSTIASGYYSTTTGSHTTANGAAATAMGLHTTSRAYGGLSIGVYNDNTDSPNPEYPANTDRLFQIGNGYSFFGITRSNAFTVLRNGNIGIGMTTPDFLLSFAPILGDKISLFGNSGSHYGLGIQSYLMQIHTDAADADIAFGYGSSSSLTERMRIVNSGESGLKLNGRIELKNGTLPLNDNYGAGIWLYNSDNSAVLGFMGTQNNQNIGFYGGPAGWGFTYDAINSRVGIGNQSPDYPFEVNGDAFFAGYFVNTSSSGGIGVGGSCTNSMGFGVAGEGGDVGVYGEGANWGGWFLGDIYTTGIYEGSDRKLKNDIRSLNGALSIINQLSPSVYTYKTTEFKQMRLPEGLHYGLIADEVQNILPGIVKKAVQAARYENHDEVNGKKLSNEVEFNTVNYTEVIPILIGAVQEQQAMIEELRLKNQIIDQQQLQINALSQEIQLIKDKMK